MSEGWRSAEFSGGAPPIEPGQVLGGKYRVDSILARGGMGVVVEATHLQLRQRVAIKFCRSEGLSEPTAVERFFREARAASAIRSEHVVRIMDVGSLDSGAPDTLPYGVPYIVMEYLEGSDLAHVLRARGALPVAEAVGYVLQACEAIAEAHIAGIVHRDLKPANLVLTRRADGSPVVKVVDFGISKVRVLEGEGAITDEALLMGTPFYMSPEQLTATRDVDARADVWALGVILFELVTAAQPFRADTGPELCARILTGPPDRLAAVRPDASAALEDAILRCLEKDPAARFADVGELALALAPLAPDDARLSVDRVVRLMSRSTATTRGRTPPGATVALHDESTIHVAGRLLGRSRASKRLSAAAAIRFGAVSIALAAAVAGAMVLRPHGGEASPPPRGDPAVSSASPAAAAESAVQSAVPKAPPGSSEGSPAAVSTTQPAPARSTPHERPRGPARDAPPAAASSAPPAGPLDPLGFGDRK
jgi:serine/threonine-protein kinase